MAVIHRITVAVLLALLTACATPLTKNDIENIRHVGVLNTFPDYPNYTIVGTTIFNNEYGKIEDPSLKSFITNELIEQLSSRGISAKEISDETKNSGVDLILVVVPRDIYNMIDTYGYGLYQRSMFGVKAFKKSYVAMNIRPTINGKSRCDSCYGQSLTALPIDEMPEIWSDLDVAQQEQLIELLKKDIKNAVDIAFKKTGL